ncbi:pyruvate, phosphate dikinase [Candidatus Pelagibacter sp. HIMB1321]|uniref:pyruvate, phosphate dikinase n=1 Tax=Candidatus Pelagibacter sp. HIMB1321 TaxID=1388755 RepID=UPI000A0808D0|nr:pyruvate, phosphate dikinase [Candidatus Pelagibacter sp. HIMB1321]SMF78994.1 pyruvate phosphate dikinase [Candidatus Pelagibacter sp. HIMB1321]
MNKFIFNFSSKEVKKIKNPKNILGGKGANLSEMGRMGFPVPPGFTISTNVCDLFYKNKKKLNSKIINQIKSELKVIEKVVKKKFGDLKNPLLLSVRSGARVSMPGMMDTILNLGLNDETVKALSNKTLNGRFAKDSYRRFIQMYGNVVLGVESHHFEELIENYKLTKGVLLDTELDESDWDGLISDFKKVVKEKTQKDFPQNVYDQLLGAISAVFLSWESNRAKIYRKLNQIPSEWGTAVNVQSMVFGNMGNDCATGVVFTRNPSDGSNDIYGEYLINAQGEDVVAGTRTPQYITKKARKDANVKDPSMEESMPKVYKQLEKILIKLETHYKDMQDVEFTVENNKLWILQTRSGKRTSKSAVKIAVDMVKEKLISKKQAILRIDPSSLDTLLHPTLDEKSEINVIANGLPASPGAASGKVVFTSEEAEKLNDMMQDTILVRVETSPEDIQGMHAAKGILTARGGMTSHAAVVARGMGRPCVSGSSEIDINYESKIFKTSELEVKEGDIITIDGSTGRIILGKVPTVKPEISGDFSKLMSWADDTRKLKVRTNSETPIDTKTARDFGAEGIGLCRTEHMFFDEERILSVREMILSKSKEDRAKALAKLLPHQKKDFVEIFKIMDGLPVTVRLLDPPLHEFLPHSDKEIQEVANVVGVDLKEVKSRISELHEQNPMLGHRGCRLGISYPEIYEMQCRAIFEALVELKKNKVKSAFPEIMIPLVSTEVEIKIMKELVNKIAKTVQEENKVKIDFMVGTMIELPRAAVKAKDIAKHAEFFSFGTNDLTQTTFGISRDDSGKFLNDYIDNKIFDIDPFVSIDEGVEDLIEIAVLKGKKQNKKIKLGICGEHGGDPKSIAFCSRVGLNYVSCSPYRVPIARLAAAQAEILKK